MEHHFALEVGLKIIKWNFIVDAARFYLLISGFYSLSRVGINIMVGDHQQEQKHAQNVGENGQLHVSDHFEGLSLCKTRKIID